MTIQTAAFADIQGTPTLSAGQELNISSGVLGVSGGDLQWTGTQINFLGNAKAFILSGNQTSSFPNFSPYRGARRRLRDEPDSGYFASVGTLS